MIEPEVTAVLGRRLLAFLLDSSLVAATGLGVAFQQSSAFAVVGRDPADKALVDPAEFEAMEEMLDFELLGQSEILGFPVVRAQELGESVRVFSADSYQFGLLAAVVAALIVFAVVPAVLQRTIGMLPLGLGIRKIDGTRAGVGTHLKRTIVGFIDAIPFVIPGALGFITSRASSHRQRLGDRFAKTVVVDLVALRKLPAGDAVDLELRATQAPPEAAMAAETDNSATDDSVTDNSATDTDAAGIGAGAASARAGFDSESTFADAPSSPASARLAEAAKASPETAVPPAKTEQTTLAAPREERRAPSAAKPPAAKPAFGDPLPPPPVHRKASPEHPLGTPSSRGTDQPTSDTAAEFDIASEVDAPTASVVDHLNPQPTLPLDIDSLDASNADAANVDEVHVPDGTWQPPSEQPAPVWQPTTLETAPVESPDPHNGRAIDELERIDPSIGALLADDSTGDERSDTDLKEQDNQHESSAKTPVWSDKWRAWMYWDTTRKCWLRHDTMSNTWQPVD